MKKALVTGASSGIGRAIYDHLKQRGMEVTGISRSGPDYNVDMKGDERWNFLGPETKLPHFDVVVLNHGILEFNEALSEGDTYRTNFQSFWDFLENQGWFVPVGGVIIINASVAGVIGDISVPFYAALKAGLINMTRSYAKKYLTQDVRVNCFSCGFFNTNLVPEETPEELINTIPMKREAQPKEITPVIDMLIDCRYITGQNIIVDGGMCL